MVYGRFAPIKDVPNTISVSRSRTFRIRVYTKLRQGSRRIEIFNPLSVPSMSDESPIVTVGQPQVLRFRNERFDRSPIPISTKMFKIFSSQSSF
jgi:hypothetical protein